LLEGSRHADESHSISAWVVVAEVHRPVRHRGGNGSIIDFVQNRLRCSLGRVRQELRGWTGLPVSRRLQPSLFSAAMS